MATTRFHQINAFINKASHAPHAAHLSWMQRFQERVQTLIVTELGQDCPAMIVSQNTALVAAVQTEDEAYRTITRSPLSDQIAEADQVRDNTLRRSAHHGGGAGPRGHGCAEGGGTPRAAGHARLSGEHQRGLRTGIDPHRPAHPAAGSVAPGRRLHHAGRHGAGRSAEDGEPAGADAHCPAQRAAGRHRRAGHAEGPSGRRPGVCGDGDGRQRASPWWSSSRA